MGRRRRWRWRTGDVPLALVRGSRVSSAGSGGVGAGGHPGIVICRRQRPIWMTSGMSVPTGTLQDERAVRPGRGGHQRRAGDLAALVAGHSRRERLERATGHVDQRVVQGVGRAVSGRSRRKDGAADGGLGARGAGDLLLAEVVAGAGTAGAAAADVGATAPQGSPPGQAPQSSASPQPSPTRPHSRPPGWSQAIGRQAGSRGAPQSPRVPPPPQVRPAGQSSPQSRVPPQPSPTLPQYLPPGAAQPRRWHGPLSGRVATGASVVVGGAASGRTKPLPPAPLPPLPARPGLIEPPAPPAPVPLMDGDPHPRTSSATMRTRGRPDGACEKPPGVRTGPATGITFV